MQNPRGGRTKLYIWFASWLQRGQAGEVEGGVGEGGVVDREIRTASGVGGMRTIQVLNLAQHWRGLVSITVQQGWGLVRDKVSELEPLLKAKHPPVVNQVECHPSGGATHANRA